MNRILLFTFSLFVFGFVSCNRGIEDKNTEIIDSLLTHIVDAHRVLDMLDSNHLATMKAEYDKQNEFFTNAPTDFSNKDFYTGPLMDMATCRKRISNTLVNMSTWRATLNHTQKQLTTLRHDYSHGLRTAEEFEKHLGIEGRAANNILTETTKNVGACSGCIGNFNALIAKLDSAQNVFSTRTE